jgi:hypothetical protein
MGARKMYHLLYTFLAVAKRAAVPKDPHELIAVLLPPIVVTLGPVTNQMAPFGSI